MSEFELLVFVQVGAREEDDFVVRQCPVDGGEVEFGVPEIDALDDRVA